MLEINELEEKKVLLLFDNLEKTKIINPFLHYLVLFKNKKAIGYIKYTIIYERLEIEKIFILNEYRGKKHSLLLMDKLFLLAQNFKSKNITLEVNENNTIALNLYKKYGFEIVSIRKNYYGNSNAFLMIKKFGD